LSYKTRHKDTKAQRHKGEESARGGCYLFKGNSKNKVKGEYPIFNKE
jgi:hypothetical protein